MTIVLMDNRHHRTMRVQGAPRRFCVPVAPPMRVQWDTPEVFSTRPSYLTAEFAHQGDFLRGDPVYLQVAGPEVPGKWWHQ